MTARAFIVVGQASEPWPVDDALALSTGGLQRN